MLMSDGLHVQFTATDSGVFEQATTHKAALVPFVVVVVVVICFVVVVVICTLASEDIKQKDRIYILFFSYPHAAIS